MLSSKGHLVKKRKETALSSHTGQKLISISGEKILLIWRKKVLISKKIKAKRHGLKRYLFISIGSNRTVTAIGCQQEVYSLYTTLILRRLPFLPVLSGFHYLYFFQ